ncbi:hypothetical protein Ahy_A05g022663 [Arachis hypogaea]|uniref:CCHC-type domain-containing protein n=1 Tax=Arachis hypogaea TaxID=3818 RepID=A0A445D148_ARAHY|nr:hypothetical protein Ahy_A05g022663 [Arachis hypogaea]
MEAWREEERYKARDIVESRVTVLKWHRWITILRKEQPYKEMDRVVPFVYHHMGCLKRVRDGNVIYEGGLVTEIHRSVVEVNPPGDEKETEVVSEETGEVNQLNKALTVVVKETLNEVVIEKGVDVNESDKCEGGVMNGDKETEQPAAPEKVVKRVRKRHPRPPPSGLSQERRVAKSEQPEGDPVEAETVNEETNEKNDDDAHVANEGANIEEPLVDELRAEEAATQNAAGANIEEPVVDELRAEETATKNAADTETQRKERTNTRRNHPRPQPSGQRIVPEKDDEAPRVEVPNPNKADGDMGPEMYQYESDELYSPPGSDDEDEPLTIEAYNRTYQFHINSIPSQEYWEHHERLPCLPPPYKRPIGRPSKKRKKDSNEQDFGSQYNAKRRYGQITCQTCKRVGHNSRTCPEILTGTAAQETMEAAHAAHVADEKNLTQNHPESQPDENTEADMSTTTTAAPPNAATTPATSLGPAPPVAARPIGPTPPIPPRRGTGRTNRRGRNPSSTVGLPAMLLDLNLRSQPHQPMLQDQVVGLGQCHKDLWLGPLFKPNIQPHLGHQV